MQKRSDIELPAAYDEQELPDAFPIIVGERHYQSDRPITQLHCHNYLELGYCYKGTGIFIVEDKMMSYGPGDCVVINRAEMHLASSTRGTTSEWVFIMVDPERLLADSGDRDYTLCRSADLGGSAFRNIIVKSEHPVLCRNVRLLAEELAATGPGHQTLVQAMMWDMMVRLHRMLPVGAHTPAAAPEPVTVIAPALSYIARHYRQQVRSAELAARCNLSVPHFRRLFKNRTGCPALEYLNRYRVRTACALLETTEMRIIDISLECGFETLSSFNRQFKKITGCAPREWRKR